MKIGIMGGTFDPIHNGHVMLGKTARDIFKLDEIWFMPNGNPPHKENESIESSKKHRMEMVHLAIAEEETFVLQPYEVNRKEVNYSYLTMEYFVKVYPEHEFYFIIGADSLFALEKWAHPDILLKTCIILAAYRDGIETADMERQIRFLNQKYDADVRLLSMPEIPVSSTEIRERLKKGLSVKEMIPENVYDYIVKNKLFVEDKKDAI